MVGPILLLVSLEFRYYSFAVVFYITIKLDSFKPFVVIISSATRCSSLIKAVYSKPASIHYFGSCRLIIFSISAETRRDCYVRIAK